MKPQNKWIKFLLIGLIIIMMFILGRSLKGLQPEQIIRYAEDHRSIAALIILGLYAIKSVLFIIPISILYMSTGIIFSPEKAVLINIMGVMIELTITFFLGKYLGEDRVRKVLEQNPKMKRLKGKKLDDVSTVFLLRFVPIFPIDFVSLILGTVNNKYSGYLIASVVGLMPRVILFSLMGDAIKNPWTKEFIIPFIILGLLSYTGISIYKKWYTT